jgi:hypothetical protein
MGRTRRRGVKGPSEEGIEGLREGQSDRKERESNGWMGGWLEGGREGGREE